IASLAGIKPIKVHCCINLCIAYTKKYIHHEECPYCQEPRYSKTRTPRRTFSYLPIIPHLQAFFQKPEIIKLLSY
ncbi:hypothetical protein PAXRUDRAFT_83954, partial [Paxillus rubicundulus Ve08.2h10]